MTAISTGDVETPAGTLKCTLRAAKAVNAHFGNYQNAIVALESLNQDAFFFVVAAGLGIEQDKADQAVFSAGMDKLITPVSRYVVGLANGGRLPAVSAESEGSPKGEA